MAQIVIFGVADFASLAHFYLEHDSAHRVVAFTVTDEYLPASGIFEGLPVVPFEAVADEFPAAEHSFFAPMSPRTMNRAREAIYTEAKGKGYALISYVSSRAIVFPNTSIGDNCFILEANVIQPHVTIGNDVVLWSGNHIGHHSTVGDHVMFTSHVVLSGHCVVESYSFLGVNSTVRDGVRIAEGSFVAMAAAVTRDTEPWSVYRGNPARKTRVSSLAFNP